MVASDRFPPVWMEGKAKELPELPESEYDAAACPATRSMAVSLGITQGGHDARTSSDMGLTQCSNRSMHTGGPLLISSSCQLHAFPSHRAEGTPLSIMMAKGDVPA